MSILALVTRLYAGFLHYASALRPAMLLLARLQMAHVFWVSGILKISEWDNTIALFTDEHPVPHLSPWFAAVSATTFELSCPVLLTFGLATRLATLPMLAMTAVIYFTYDNAIEHVYWALVLGLILVSGAGKWSVDYLVTRFKTLSQRERVERSEG